MNAGLAVFDRPPLSRDVIVGFVGNGTRKLVEGSLRASGLAPTEEAIDRAYAVFRGHYDAHLLDQTRAYPGVDSLLAALAANGVVLSVLTNKLQRPSERILAGLGLAGRFRAVLGGDDETARKPNPAGLLRLVAEAGILPAEALLVGDSDVDVATARAAGVPVCGVTWGFQSPERIRGAGATWLVERPEEILVACVRPA